jgi:hypothetical protein
MLWQQPEHYFNEAANKPQHEITFWAWEKPEDFSSLRPGQNSVAFLLKTFLLEDHHVWIKNRMQPIVLPPYIYRFPVYRIEVRNRAALDILQQKTIADAIIHDLHVGKYDKVQIDFDASKSQRNFYRELLKDLRTKTGNNIFISITALASWCLDDSWIADLPVDEAVPMLFQMGIDDSLLRERLNERADFSLSLCRSSYGISLDELPPITTNSKNVYVFSSTPWSAANFQRLKELL